MKATTLAALCALALLAGCSHDQPKPEAPPQRLPNQVQDQPTPLELLRTNAEFRRLVASLDGRLATVPVTSR